MANNDRVVKNQDEFSALVKDWLDSAVENEKKEAKAWLEEQIKDRIPELDLDEVQSVVSDIKDYGERISSLKDELEKASANGMSRGEWFSRKLKDWAGEASEEALGEMVGEFGNSMLAQLEKTANEFEIQNSDGTSISPLNIIPDVLPPKFGWNSESIKDRAIDITKVIGLLTTTGVSNIDDSLIVDGGKILLSDPEKFKDILLNGDKSKIIMAMTGALKEGVAKQFLNLESCCPTPNFPSDTIPFPTNKIPIPGIPIKFPSDMIPFPLPTDKLPFPGPNGPLPKSPFPNIDIPMLAGISSQTVEFAKQCLKGEVQAEKVVDGMIDSATATTVGIVDVAASKYGMAAGAAAGTFLGSLIAPICPVAPAIGGKIGAMVGGFVAQKVVQPVKKMVRKISNVAKTYARKAIDGVRSVCGSVCNGIKSFASGICSGISSIASSVGSFLGGLFS